MEGRRAGDISPDPLYLGRDAGRCDPMKPPAKPKEIKSAEDLAAELARKMVELIRQHDRNCRCPRCLPQGLPCVECEWCVANLRKLLVDALTSAPFFVLNFFTGK